MTWCLCLLNFSHVHVGVCALTADTHTVVKNTLKITNGDPSRRQAPLHAWFYESPAMASCKTLPYVLEKESENLRNIE